MELLLSILGGGATGLLGTMFSRIFSLVEKREERIFILQKYQLDAQERARERESEAAIADMRTSAEMVQASYGHDTNVGCASQWVINLLRLVRPTLTVLLWLLVGMVWCTVGSAYDLQNQIISTILYCATAATLWWFGTRDKRA